MGNAVIVGALRTAVGKRNGKLSTVRPDDLAALVVNELVARAKIDPNEIEDVIMGAARETFPCVDGSRMALWRPIGHELDSDHYVRSPGTAMLMACQRLIEQGAWA